MRYVLYGPRTSIVRGNCVRETSVKRRKKKKARNNAKCSKCFQFYAIIAVEHSFSMHLHSPGPLGGVKTAASGLGFQPPAGPGKC